MGNKQASTNSATVSKHSSCYNTGDYLKKASCSFLQRYHRLSQTFLNRETPPSMSISDYTLYQCLGKGAFAKVYLAQKREPEKLFFAIKILNKKKVVADHQADHVFSEKRILSAVDFRFLIRLQCSFHDPSNLYLVLEFMPGGELFSLLRSHLCFTEVTAKFYAAQIVLALEYLHHLNIAYRDLKPENILIGHDGYLRMADFGFAKLVPNRTYTLCGTPEYLAPEIIASRGYSRAVDWWAFGVLVFELVAGYSPFFSEQSKHIYEKILATRFSFPRHFSKDIRSLIGKLLEPDLTKRIGMLKSKVDDVKEQRWFRDDFEWAQIYDKTLDIPEEIKNHKIHRPLKLGNVTVLSIEKENAYGDLFEGF